MKRKEIKELHTKTVEELKKMLADSKDALTTLLLEKEQGKLKNVREISHKRADIARIQTVKHGKEKENV